MTATVSNRAGRPLLLRLAILCLSLSLPLASCLAALAAEPSICRAEIAAASVASVPMLAQAESGGAPPAQQMAPESDAPGGNAVQQSARPSPAEEHRISRSRFHYLMLGYGLIWVCLAVYLFSLNGRVGKAVSYTHLRAHETAL
ncbi:MAG: hypothetical protein QUU85_14965, partial [Candidatus Eisenbacteria bacterium]|nr:hypothetical protein [Candidatus Eisenbacteria bacterium]